MSVFHHLPLGRRIPDRLHAVSVSLPTMRDLIGYEEKDPAVTRHIGSGYPRFVLHPRLRQLTEHLTRQHGLAGRTLWLTTSECSAAELTAHLASSAHSDNTEITPFAANSSTGSGPVGLHGVSHPENPELAGEAKSFLQHTGMFLGSRQAEDILVQLGVLPAAEPEPLFVGDASAEIKRVLRCALPATGDADLFHACSGMNAIYSAFRAVSELQAARGRTIWVQLGWLYRDTISILKQFPSDPARDYVYLYSVSDQAALERLFAEHGSRIAGIFAETPTNPLIQTPDVPALAGLARRHGARLILDPSIASLFCVDVLAYADVVVNSLTKFAARDGDIMAGLVAVNPAGPDAVGGMLSFTLKTPLAPFYDAVRLPKGPSFGMTSSLISPFIYIAHYDLVKDAAGRAELAAGGIDPDLLRLSVGAEPVDDIIAALADALEA